MLQTVQKQSIDSSFEASYDGAHGVLYVGGAGMQFVSDRHVLFEIPKNCLLSCTKVGNERLNLVWEDLERRHATVRVFGAPPVRVESAIAGMSP